MYRRFMARARVQSMDFPWRLINFYSASDIVVQVRNDEILLSSTA